MWFIGVPRVPERALSLDYAVVLQCISDNRDDLAQHLCQSCGLSCRRTNFLAAGIHREFLFSMFNMGIA